MATILARKFFSRRVTLPGNTVMSFAALMRAAPAVAGTPAWGTNADGSPSQDSFWGDGATIIPVSQTIYNGYDARVSAVNSATSYQGVPVAAAVPFSLQDYCPGPVDTEHVFFYSVNTQSVDLIFQGRQ